MDIGAATECAAGAGQDTPSEGSPSDELSSGPATNLMAAEDSGAEAREEDAIVALGEGSQG
jgi:hypothetical protein